MGYQAIMTKAGYALQARLFAEGGEFNVTRVEVGSGVWPEGTDLSAVTELAQSKAVATSTAPRRDGCEVSLAVEYRSDLNGGLDEPFQISEFGVFALGAEREEVLLIYGDLSDYPEAAVPQRYGGCVRRYPINVIIGPDADVSLGYPAGAWVTHDDLEERIAAHNVDPAAHEDIRARMDGIAAANEETKIAVAGIDARLILLELMYRTQVSGNPFVVTFGSLDGVGVTGVWNTAQKRIEF